MRGRGLIITALLAMAVSLPSFAEGLAESAVRSTKPAIAIGLAVSLFSSEKQGLERASRTAEAVTLSIGIARLVKQKADITFGTDYHNSFPSGHAAGAFALATSLSDIHPKNKWLYYAGAAVIGWSLVETDNHSWQDVAGGAALGIAVGKMEVRYKGGLILGRTFQF